MIHFAKLFFTPVETGAIFGSLAGSIFGLMAGIKDAYDIHRYLFIENRNAFFRNNRQDPLVRAEVNFVQAIMNNGWN